ncbi:MAG: helix-turn-helix transcriptional regulator [Phycisphaeraceae bacterium]
MGVSRVHRLLRLITLLQSGHARSVRELMDELGVSRRTLFRDLNMLQMAGVPYYHEPGQGYRISRGFFLPPISLTVPETLGLMVLGKLAAAQRNRPFTPAALSAIYKLLSTVPEPIRSVCGEMMSHVSINDSGALTTDREQQHYGSIQQCIDERRACRITYRSPVESDALDLELHPYALHFAARAWYAIGWSKPHEEVRTFKLARIEALEPLQRRFRRPERFDATKKIGNAWQLIPEGREYDIELEFSSKVGRNVAEVRWHASQQHELLPDGRCRMRFRVDGLNEIAWWICGYADQVTIKKPAALRQRVREMLKAALMNHET